MFKTIILTSTATLLASASASYAQDHSDHDGHDHGPQPQSQTAKPAPDLPAPDFVFTEAPDDHAIGGDFAPITMITYASVTCSHCGNWFSNTWPKVKADLVETDKIRFILRELPTAPAALSMTGFAMSECAPKDKYMSIIEYQMENQKDIFEQTRAGNGQEAYAKIGKLAGLNDNEAITACLTDRSKVDHIGLSQRRANAAGVAGVPAFFINGEEYKGDQSAEAIIKLVNGMIETGSSTLPAAPQKQGKPTDKIKIKPAITTIK